MLNKDVKYGKFLTLDRAETKLKNLRQKTIQWKGLC